MIRSIAIFVTVLSVFVAPAFPAEPPTVKVYKTPTCGCCTKWVAHLRQHGFAVSATDMPDVSQVRAENKVPKDLSSCHTALVEGYVIEGHVPAEDIVRLLKKRPPVLGLAVPKMPIGSPGMEGANPEPYDVLSFDRGGRAQVFSSHPASAPAGQSAVKPGGKTGGNLE